MTYKPPPDAASVFARYKQLHEGERELKPEMLALADRELKAGASVGQLAKLTGLLPEVFRRRARALGIERKRPPTVGKLASSPPSAKTSPREASACRPASEPEYGGVELAVAQSCADLAYEKATPAQIRELDEVKARAKPGDEDYAVAEAAYKMGLVTNADIDAARKG